MNAYTLNSVINQTDKEWVPLYKFIMGGIHSIYGYNVIAIRRTWGWTAYYAEITWNVDEVIYKGKELSPTTAAKIFPDLFNTGLQYRNDKPSEDWI